MLFSTVLVFLPLATGFVSIFIPNRTRSLTKALALVIPAAFFAASIWLFVLTASGEFIYRHFPLQILIVSFKLKFILTAGPLATFMLMFAGLFGLLIALYSLKSMAQSGNFNIFFAALFLTLGGSAGILLSGNLLFLLIFWEIVTASLYLLITTGGKNSNFAATKSFAMIGASDAALLLGVLIVWVLSGTLSISGIQLTTDSALPIIAFLLLMVAAITKAGAMPLHSWLPTSGQYAPVSVMALLPAAIDKLLGIYLLVLIVRQLFVVNSEALKLVLTIIGAATILIAVMVAMVQHNLKKLLSYHAISQVGYMILGIATGTAVGIAGGVFHMLNNAIYKSCLFLGAGTVEQQAKTAELDKLGGLGRKMPITFIASLIAALSISGIPPLNGFVSKWMVYQGVIDMGANQTGVTATLWPIWLVAAVFGSALTLASFVKVIHSVFLSRLPEKLNNIKEASYLQTSGMIVLAFLCVVFGVFYYLPLKSFIYPALDIDFGTAIFGNWDSVLATALMIFGIVLGLVILLIALISRTVREVPTWTCGEVQDNEDMIIPGTAFYKTVSSMNGLKQLYYGQEKGYFDPYNQSGKVGLGLTAYLRYLHSGILPRYLTWLTLGLLIVLFIICNIW